MDSFERMGNMYKRKRVKEKNIVALVVCAVIFFVTVLYYSVKAEEVYTGPSVEELAGISPAVGYLAARAEACDGFIYTPEKERGSSNFAYLYDSAAAIVALSEAGAVRQAGLIADALVFAMEHDRYFSDGRLRNAYVGGNPRKESGWSIFSGAEAVRLPGSWRDGVWAEDYYSVSTSTGNMAWVILALCEASRGAPEGKAEEYAAAAERAADFVLTLKSEQGGFTGGYEGWDKTQKKASYKSTEHNIDLISAFTSLASLVREANPAKAELYEEAAEHAEAFVLLMYDKRLNCFYTGTEDDGRTISKGVLPLDTNTWAILALEDSFSDAEQVIDFVENNMAVGAGFDFSAGDLDGIWHEGTAQMAVCYQAMGNTEAYERIMAYLSTQTAEDGSITAADRDGVSTGFMVSGTDVLWVYNNTTNLGATNWLAFAQMKVNPLRKR